MDVATGIAILGVIFLGIGLLATWKRDNRTTANEDAQVKSDIAVLKNDVKAVKQELSSEDHGLVALAKGQGDFKTHCAAVSTELSGRIAAVEDKTGAKSSKGK